MKNKSQHAMTKDMRKQLHGASAPERLLHRLHSVALVLHGLSASEAARIYDDSPRAVAYWVKRFKANGVAGLNEEARPGRPSSLSPLQLRRLQTFVARLKKLSKPVNAETVANYLLKENGITLTSRQCWRILKRLRT